jgi:hypothetical protein
MPKEIRLWRDLSAKIEPAEASAFPAASLLERSVNPVYGTAGLVSESKIGKIPYRESRHGGTAACCRVVFIHIWID